MNPVFEKILVMVLTIVVLVAGAYFFLLLLGWGLKIKSGDRERQGLTDLWIDNQAIPPEGQSDDHPSDGAP